MGTPAYGREVSLLGIILQSSSEQESYRSSVRLLLMLCMSVRVLLISSLIFFRQQLQVSFYLTDFSSQVTQVYILELVTSRSDQIWLESCFKFYVVFFQSSILLLSSQICHKNLLCESMLFQKLIRLSSFSLAALSYFFCNQQILIFLWLFLLVPLSVLLPFQFLVLLSLLVSFFWGSLASRWRFSSLNYFSSCSYSLSFDRQVQISLQMIRRGSTYELSKAESAIFSLFFINNQFNITQASQRTAKGYSMKFINYNDFNGCNYKQID